MRWLRYLLIALYIAALAAMVIASTPAFAADPRYCVPIVRDADGSIHRSAKVLGAFRREHPCPSTGLTTGTCTGWSIDHVIPLASCGCDAVGNLQWLPNSIKSCAGTECKDRWERKVYLCPSAALP